MCNFTFYANSTLTLVCVPVGPPAAFPLEDAARLTGVHPELLRYYQRVGLIEAASPPGEVDPCFAESALTEIRRLEHYRRHLGVGRRALPLLCALRCAGERQRITFHFLRAP